MISSITLNIRYINKGIVTFYRSFTNVYMLKFTGDSVRNDVERIVRQLRNPLQLRLRHIFFAGSRIKYRNKKYFTRFIAQIQLKTEEGALKQLPQGQIPVKTEENSSVKQEFKQEFKTEFKSEFK